MDEKFTINAIDIKEGFINVHLISEGDEVYNVVMRARLAKTPKLCPQF
jgi:hypothetical protein